MFFGLPAMPTILLNIILSFFRDRSVAVRGSDKVAVFTPMYNEREGARRCLNSLLDQTCLPDHLIVSINGGSDSTYGVVASTLLRRGFERSSQRLDASLDAGIDTWVHPERNSSVTVLDYYQQVSKSESVNNIVKYDLSDADRILVTDGDTVFHQDFIKILRDHYYRLTLKEGVDGKSAVLEDFALQSGTVTSYVPKGASWVGRLISLARSAEYAFGGVLRRGQSRMLGDSALFGYSRLYTVVGCGFVVRRDLLPLPSDTKTEDHDLTLKGQNITSIRTRVSAHDLRASGFRAVVEGREVPLEQLLEGVDKVEFRCGGNARFIESALMKTQDPPHLDGYFNQIERWHGGAQQNALKRIGQALRPNVAFTVWAAIFENLLSILLWVGLVTGVALHIGNPTLGFSFSQVLLMMLVDLGIVGVLSNIGLYRYYRAAGRSRVLSGVLSLAHGSLALLPYMMFRYLNVLAYLVSAIQVVPGYLWRQRKVWRADESAWERPTVRRRTLTQRLMPVGMVVGSLAMVGLVQVAPMLNPVNVEAWQLTHRSEKVDIEPYVTRVAAVSLQPTQVGPSTALEHSHYCDPTFTPYVADAQGSMGARGDASAYRPLSRWEMVAFVRFAPLIGYFDSAVKAYDVPANLLLRILLNESYLDPLAEGPTDDYGLSQQTSDSLTLLRAIAEDEQHRHYNGRLFADAFSVYNVDFSICAGAAKLAWALTQPEATSDQRAYALYINPIDSIRNGEMSDIHRELTDSMMRLVPLANVIENAFAAHAQDPTSLAPRDQQVMAIVDAVRDRRIGLEQAYRQAYDLAVRHDLPDEDFYRRLFAEYFAQTLASR